MRYHLGRAKYNYTTGPMIGLLTFVMAYCLCVVPKAYAQDTGFGPSISESKVYDNLDDHALSLRYAKQQIKKGEMLNAGAALERMLYANPNWHSARLLYAAVLYRLDDQKAALRELSLLEGKEMNADQVETYTRYKAAFSQPPRQTFAGVASSGSTGFSARNVYRRSDPIQASVTLGVRADNNAGNALTDEGFGFDNRGDVSGVIEAQFKARKPLNSDGSITAHVKANGLVRRHETFARADYDVLDASVGITSAVDQERVTIELDARKINISGENYLQQFGPRVTVSEPLSETVRGSLSFSAHHQNYDELSFASREDERDGLKLSGQFGILKKINDSHRLTIVAGYDLKTADLNAFAYEGPVIAAGYERPLGQNYAFKSHIRLRRLNYDGSLASTTVDRRDTRVSARAAVARPFSLDSALLRNAQIELGVNYNKRNSTIEFNDFSNIGADLRLTTNF